MTTRRAFTFGAMALGLSGCVGGGARTPRNGGVRAPDPVLQAVPNAGWDAWVEGFRGRSGVSGATFDNAFASAGFLPGVIEKDRNQTEFTRTTEDYLAIAASDERLSLGASSMGQYGGVLNEIAGRYGVEANVVAAVWGLESFFGTRRGSVPVISALSTLAYEGRRGEFFEGQLVAALKILQNGDVSPQGMTGSWAGAMGHTQFIPTSYLAYAVDFRGDGRRDIWGDDPTDALASTAAYFNKSGWRQGQPWGLEVRLPGGFDTGLIGRGRGRSAGEWNGLGVTRTAGGAVPDHGGASIIMPSGGSGPAFMLFNNFNVILRYNNAENYAIGIGHLSDRLAGGGPIQAAFPPDATGMSKADRQDLQRRLTAAGFDTEGSDGVIGAKTKAAIAAYQTRMGLAVTGEPSLELLAALR